MSARPLYEEVIEEIGTQTLASFNLNIFSFDTYKAYAESVKMTNENFRAYEQHKNNPQFFGQNFEELDIGTKNILSALNDDGSKTYTTDTLSAIEKVQNLAKSGKNIANLNAKDRANYDFIMANYGDEVESLNFNSKTMQDLKNSSTTKLLKNHTSTDTVTLKNGKIINKAQLKVIKDTKGLLEDRYLQNNDAFIVPYDDYKTHEANLKQMIENAKNPADKEKAQKALKMLQKNEHISRQNAKNPRATSVVAQSATAAAHIAQAGASDAIVVILSSIASSAIYEIKDAFVGDTKTPLEKRVKRLLENILNALKEAKSVFLRGSSFGAIDALMGILGQILKSIAAKIKHIWQSIRSAAKSIYNAIYNFITGKVKSFKECLSVILKGIISSLIVASSIGLESVLEAKLGAILTPFIAGIIAPILSVVICGIAVAVANRSIDYALNALFGAFARAEMAKKQYEQIKAICDSMLPQLIADRERLETLIKAAHEEKILKLNMSFADFRVAFAQNNSSKITESLDKICKIYGGELDIKNNDDMKALLQNPNRTGKLKW